MSFAPIPFNTMKGPNQIRPGTTTGRHSLPTFRAALAGVCVLAGSVFANVATAQNDTNGDRPTSGPNNTMIVFDASGSMWGQIDGTSKIEIARDAFAAASTIWSGRDASVGLIAFGHRRKGDCRDIEMLVAPEHASAEIIADKVATLTPKGKTPLSDAVTLAASQLGHRENKATVILFSDGVETCNADPCALGTKLESQGIDFTAHVIGLGISTETERAQLRCLAENTGGLYRDAADAGGLVDALGEVTAIQAAAPPAPEAPTTTPVALHVDLVIAQGSVRPDSVTLRATNIQSGEKHLLGTLSGADQVLAGVPVTLTSERWRIEAISPEGGGAVEIEVVDGMDSIKLPFAALAATFTLIDNSPYVLGVEHGFFLTTTTPLQPNAEFTVGLVARGATADGAFVDYEYRFGSDPVGTSYHTFVSPEVPGAYDVIVAQDGEIRARFPVRYDETAPVIWRGATTGEPGGALALQISGDTYYYNSFTLTKDGETASETTVDGAVSPEGWRLILPDAPGSYALGYNHSGLGDPKHSDLATILVGNVLLPDDPDTVAPPAKTVTPSD